MDIVWFKISDLRIRDHEPLFTANQADNSIIHIFIWDCRWDDKTENDILIMGKYKKNFLKESLYNLSENLKKINIHLNLYFGKTEDILINIINKHNVKNIYTHQDNVYDMNKLTENTSVKIESFWNNTMYHINDLPFPIKELPDSFTDFKKNMTFNVKKEFFTKSNNKSIKLDNSIKLNDIDIPEATIIIKGGEDAGWEQLKSFFYKTNNILKYNHERHNLTNTWDLSPWLDFGCLSAKSIFYQIKMYEKSKQKNNSTYLYWLDMLLKDYYKFKSIKIGNDLFKQNGVTNKIYNYSNNKGSLQKWIDGQTGIPLIDAFMNQIKNTGLISNKGRLIVSSFLINDLNLDWTLGAEYFNKMLINSETSYNYGIMQYIAGLGSLTDNHIYFNPIKQAKILDKNCDYIKHWIPELKDISINDLVDPKDGIVNYHDILVKINFINKINIIPKNI